MSEVFKLASTSGLLRTLRNLQLTPLKAPARAKVYFYCKQTEKSSTKVYWHWFCSRHNPDPFLVCYLGFEKYKFVFTHRWGWQTWCPHSLGPGPTRPGSSPPWWRWPPPGWRWHRMTYPHYILADDILAALSPLSEPLEVSLTSIWWSSSVRAFWKLNAEPNKRAASWFDLHFSMKG